MELIRKKRVLGWRVSKPGALVRWQNGSPKTEDPNWHIGSKNLQKKSFFLLFPSLAGTAPLMAKWGEVIEKAETSAPGQTHCCSAKLLHQQDVNFCVGAGLYQGLILGRCNSQSRGK